MGRQRRIRELPQLHGQMHVFPDRSAAGEVLAEMMDTYSGTDALALAIPAGGVPVAAALAARLHLALDVAVACKISTPFDPESGYGAVAFDGTVTLDRDFIARVGFDDESVEQDIDRATQKVRHRVVLFHGERPRPEVARRAVILVDDGLASGLTMAVTIKALRRLRAAPIVVAIPTGYDTRLRRATREADRVYCPNIRGGKLFAVANAYEIWSDVTEAEALALLPPRVGPAPVAGPS